MTQNKILLYALYGLRKAGRKLGVLASPSPDSFLCSRYVELFDQEANDFVYETLREGKPCMISKFGTTELNAVVTDLVTSEPLSWSVLKEFFRGELSLSRVQSILQLQKLSGFFPVSPDYGRRFCERVVNDIPEINILGSYIENEKYVLPYMHCKRINLDGYYAPFLWKNPWTKYLEGKKVLVVHPFVDSIKSQYENNRERLFDDPDVRPRFKELILVRAVQSIVGTRTDYVDWFEALKHMEDEISQLDFDIALIGCGAYGMALAAHVKRMGKQAVHLAGWTQMLFGIYGNRWLRDQPAYAKFINGYWIRPSESEKPKGAEKVEGGCYW